MLFGREVSDGAQMADGGLEGERMKAEPQTIYPIRMSAGGPTHSAVLRRSWDGRALCGAMPPRDRYWDMATEPASCARCLAVMRNGRLFREVVMFRRR